MKHFACLLLCLMAASAAAQSATATTAPAQPAPALSDDETLAQQLVYCGIVAQKQGGKTWAVSYGSAAVALTSAAFVATQTLSQAGSADNLSQADLDSAATQCQQTMLANSARISAAMQSKGGASQ